MRKLYIFFSVVVFIGACNNDTAKKVNEGNWSDDEQEKYIDDCKSSIREFKGAQLEAYCECMLVQARKNYPVYREMSDKATDELERKANEDCSIKSVGAIEK